MTDNEAVSNFLATAANPAWLCDQLPESLRRADEPSLQLSRVEIEHVSESPKKFTLLYRIGLQLDGERELEQRYIGYQLKDGRLDAQLRKIESHARTSPRVGRMVTVLRRQNFILAAYPNDYRLVLLGEEDFRDLICDDLPALSGGRIRSHQWQPERINLKILKYVPNKRCTTRCDVLLRHARTGERRELAFISKQLRHRKAAKASLNSMRALHKSLVGSDGRLLVNMPRALAVHEQKGAVFFEIVPGTNIQAQLDTIDLDRWIPETGALLARFHTATRRARKQVSIRNEQWECRRAARRIRASAPELNVTLQSLLRRLATLADAVRDTRVLLHGSFRLNHVLFDGSQLSLIDLDSLRTGNPAYDIANFLSALYYSESLGRMGTALRRRIQTLFLAGYQDAAHAGVSAAEVSWFLATLMINKQAVKHLNTLDQSRMDLLPATLELASELLAACEGKTAAESLRELAKRLP